MLCIYLKGLIQKYIDKKCLYCSIKYIMMKKYVCVCVCVLFSSVKPELGGIPSGQKKTFNSEHLNFPGKELSVTDITEQ